MAEPTPTPTPETDERKLRFTDQLKQMLQSGVREALAKLTGYEGAEVPQEQFPGAGTKPLPRQLNPPTGTEDLGALQERVAMEQMMGMKRPGLEYMLRQGE